MNPNAGNDELLEHFNEDGFVALRRFFAGEELPTLVAEVERFVRDVVPRLPPEQVFFEQKGAAATLKQVQQLGAHDPWFHDLITTGRLRETAERLLRGPVVPRNLQYFDKPPGVGRATPAHQDGAYFLLYPCEAVTMWLALDGADEETGCVRYVRGSHRRGLREHRRTTTLGFSQGIVDYPMECDREAEAAIAAEPGDLLVHDARTIHLADGNRSATRSRRALGFIYYSERAREDAAAHAAYQRRLAEELKTAGKI